MKFDKILEYQRIDQELIALENEVAKSKAYKDYASAKARLTRRRRASSSSHRKLRKCSRVMRN